MTVRIEAVYRSTIHELEASKGELLALARELCRQPGEPSELVLELHQLFDSTCRTIAKLKAAMLELERNRTSLGSRIPFVPEMCRHHVSLELLCSSCEMEVEELVRDANTQTDSDLQPRNQ
jgi:hypothetical protein